MKKKKFFTFVHSVQSGLQMLKKTQGDDNTSNDVTLNASMEKNSHWKK